MNRRVLILALVVVLSGRATAGEIDHASEYIACMDLIKRAPEAAFEAAITWRDMAGGAPAKHCVAASLMGLGQYEEAAKRFEDVAQEIKGKPLFKAELLGQASQAWLMAGKSERSEGAVTAALKLDPRNDTLLVDRAVARASLGRYKDAVSDLDLAITVNPTLTEAFVYRASAHRFLDNLDAAEADIKTALDLNPTHPEGLLESGIISRLKNDDAAARVAWMKILNSFPGTPAARAAQTNLEKMDVTEK